MTKNGDHLKEIVSHAKEYGFVFASSEIYDGLSAVYDYGQNGVMLRNKLKQYWWAAMVQLHRNIVGLDSAILMHPTVWKASGHVDAFSDPLIDNKDSKKRYRADVLIEDYVEKINQKVEKEIEKAKKRFGDAFNPETFVKTNSKVQQYKTQAKETLNRLYKYLDNNDLDDVKKLIEELEIADPVSGSKNWTQVRQFNLMFGTQLGSVANETTKLYLRPETAQGIFVNFLNVQKTARLKPPFGIAQIGKAFRNEIIARQFIFRMREFEQMEMQFFIAPQEAEKWYNYWKEKRMQWHETLGLGNENYRFCDHEKLAHYAKAATDIEFRFPFGFKELEGIHSRGDFDLGNHQKYSGKKLQYFDPQTNQGYVPYVIETSVGLDRLFLAVFSNCLQDETLKDGSVRKVLKLPFALAPTQIAVLPLLKKDGLSELAQTLANELQVNFDINYDDKDAIGRRYRRQDALGTPFCITIDHQSLQDQSVTLRNRDDMTQTRLPIKNLIDHVRPQLHISSLLKKLI